MPIESWNNITRRMDRKTEKESGLMEITPLSIAKTWEGTKETPGERHNPIIIGWIQSAGGVWIHDDETPWCSAFVFTMIKQCGGELPDKGLRARQWLKVGEPTPLPKLGWDIVILKRGGSNQPGPEVVDAPGHVTFFNGEGPEHKTFYGFGGNQNNAVCNVEYPSDRVLGVRRIRQLK